MDRSFNPVDARYNLSAGRPGNAEHSPTCVYELSLLETREIVRLLAKTERIEAVVTVNV